MSPDILANLGFIGLAAIAGGLGAVTRMWLDGFVSERMPNGFPWGTLVVNLSGSLLLGFVFGMISTHEILPVAIRFALGVGFLGGYTTFSATSVQTLDLLRKREWTPAALYAFGVLAASAVLAMLGLWLGFLISR